MSRCKSCGAELLWVVTEEGKRMPLDAAPAKRAVLVADVDERERDRDEGAPLMMMVNTYVSHFATCPDADKHRKVPGQQQLIVDTPDGLMDANTGRPA